MYANTIITSGSLQASYLGKSPHQCFPSSSSSSANCSPPGRERELCSRMSYFILLSPRAAYTHTTCTNMPLLFLLRPPVLPPTVPSVTVTTREGEEGAERRRGKKADGEKRGGRKGEGGLGVSCLHTSLAPLPHFCRSIKEKLASEYVLFLPSAFCRMKCVLLCTT